jgi:hypothetical protein
MDQNYFPGMLDEVRISTVVRSADWIWACWKNQGDNRSFITYEDIIQREPMGTIYIFW